MKTIAAKIHFFVTLCLFGACSDDNPTVTSLSDGASDGSTAAGTTTDEPPEDPTEDPEESGSEETSDGSGSVDDPLVCNPADIDEPNNSEYEAKPLPNITDEDGSAGRIASILAGDRDEDWFAYMGQDVAFAYVDPAGDLAADMKLRLCIFVECAQGATKPITCTNSIYEESPDQILQGCCNSGESAFVTIDLYCDGGGDDSAYVYMRVDRGHSDVCVPYEVEYHF